MVPLDLVRLTALMELTDGLPQVAIGLVDGFVFVNHPDIEQANIRDISGTLSNQCSHNATSACVHGTFVAGILSANRNSVAPSICPNCTLLIRPIFGDTKESHTEPSATAAELSQAIIDCIKADANCINLSLALAQPSSSVESSLWRQRAIKAPLAVLPLHDTLGLSP
jgi:hypothetical protein